LVPKHVKKPVDYLAKKNINVIKNNCECARSASKVFYKKNTFNGAYRCYSSLLEWSKEDGITKDHHAYYGALKNYNKIVLEWLEKKQYCVYLNKTKCDMVAIFFWK
jgi:hypothetical protein